jgi:hypothetical protein
MTILIKNKATPSANKAQIKAIQMLAPIEKLVAKDVIIVLSLGFRRRLTGQGLSETVQELSKRKSDLMALDEPKYYPMIFFRIARRQISIKRLRFGG